ncbi:Leukocyte surface antigen CD53 [Bagarius yarrelli]|uniref:Leukocyte surface antigen CD53 n=1 Tax=Bagarius yarrelli TaxID=175774 RepID=A0A556V0T3_BAGYA|nr:Leukocyte surface antigen CD53 [Bagarius yarrelli]
MSTTSKYLSIFPSLSIVNLASALYIIGIFVTCVSFLGFLGALKENRCLLISFFILLFLLMLAELTVACLLLFYEKDIDKFIENELRTSLNMTKLEGEKNSTIDWNFIQRTVLGMCFAMTLVCHISKSGLGYK